MMSQDVATHALGVMVRGIFTDIKIPYAHFPTTTTTADVLAIPQLFGKL